MSMLIWANWTANGNAYQKPTTTRNIGSIELKWTNIQIWARENERVGESERERDINQGSTFARTWHQHTNAIQSMPNTRWRINTLTVTHTQSHAIKVNYHNKRHFGRVWTYANVQLLYINIVIVMNCVQHRWHRDRRCRCCWYFVVPKTENYFCLWSQCEKAKYKFMHFKCVDFYFDETVNNTNFRANTSHRM